MKIKVLIYNSIIILLLSVTTTKAQDTGKFPFDPLVILKSWNYDRLIKTMGKGEEIISKINNQEYVAGLRYNSELIGQKGTLEFTFNQDSISKFVFRFTHSNRVVSADRSDRRFLDRSASEESKLAIQRHDSLQRIDSLSRDTIVRTITKILDQPVTNGPTPVAERFARHSAIWINHGYSCHYKDYVDYSEIIFSIPTIPLWVVGEYSIPAGTQIVKKMNVSTRKMSWTASLLGLTSDAPRIAYSDYFVIFEFSTGQRYLASVQKNAMDYLSSYRLTQFAGGQRFLLSIPETSTGFLPDMIFEDCDGDAIPEAWVTIPVDKHGRQSRHLLYSIQFKEPNVIFDTDDLIPAAIHINGSGILSVTMQDGSGRTPDLSAPLKVSGRPSPLYPKGFRYLNATKRNSDGSINFHAGIEIRLTPNSPVLGVLDIVFKRAPGEWSPEQMTFLPAEK